MRAGFEPAVQVDPVRQFSKLVVSASHPPHRRAEIVGGKSTKLAYATKFIFTTMVLTSIVGLFEGSLALGNQPLSL